MIDNPFELIDKAIGTDYEPLPYEIKPKDEFRLITRSGMRKNYTTPEENPDLTISSRSIISPKLPQVRRFKSQSGINDRARLLSMQRVRRRLMPKSLFDESYIDNRDLLSISTLKHEASEIKPKLVQFLRNNRQTPRTITRRGKNGEPLKLMSLCVVPSRPKAFVMATP
mmetsp:Transcript_1742/g.3702  ORF Transcript_1742/g.3702 Transcript_1742/m.3702 type:complete len:169 (+) Transcript_1742:304-810(+)